ncbi:fungal fruit body lectin [Chaetomium fimeti]|uniref:Fungal fruit body lectin n=1 Tax=Chaetomium fimeti TaxID=1854472 RepID=A0AAE0H852_9PEZI|nr:fungal fruit body lectin [Chaetomium fimeti]
MAYQLHVLVLNHTSSPALIEQSCWHENPTAWTTTTANTDTGGTLTAYTLSMAASGSSGMLRFRTESGAFFAVAIGVHNFKVWSDVQVLPDDKPLSYLHGRYYDQNDELNKRLWAQSSVAAGVLGSESHEVKVGFYKAEGHLLAGYLAYFPQETGQEASTFGGGIRSVILG